MTKPNRPQLSEEMRKKLKKFLTNTWGWSFENGEWLDSTGELIGGIKDLEDFLATAIEDTRLEYVKEIELLKKELFKWDYKEGEGESKNSYNEAIDDVLSILKKEKQ